jgi:hypothetical protein
VKIQTGDKIGRQQKNKTGNRCTETYGRQMRDTEDKKQQRADAKGIYAKSKDRQKMQTADRKQTADKKRYEKTDDRLYRRKKDVRFRFKKERVPQPGITVYVVSKKDNVIIILSYLFSCCF